MAEQAYGLIVLHDHESVLARIHLIELNRSKGRDVGIIHGCQRGMGCGTVSNREHWNLFLDGVVSSDIARSGLANVGDYCASFQVFVDFRIGVAKLCVLTSEMEIQEIGNMGIICTPSQHMKAVEIALLGYCYKLTRFHDHNFRVNSQILSKLILNLNGNIRYFR